MMAKVSEGDRAPQFTLMDEKGNKVAIKDFKGDKVVVLYFYPKDMTSGCTAEAQAFRDVKGRFSRVGAVILGVSPDSAESHQAFCKKNKLNFPLLVDEGHKVASTYGVWKRKSMYGKTYYGIERTTFVIGKSGKVAKVFPKVKVEGHADEVLDAVKALA